ncbi:MAG: DUF4833 domain-containing protein [Chitinophagaceae bacterium]|nr:DUF4833 domain-containing protein [Chitinophagaceae bacterium]
MKKRFKGGMLVLLTLVSLNGLCQYSSPADTFPVPKEDPDILFYLQRQPNSNTIIVNLNIKNGQVDTDNPVNVFWRRYQEDGRKARLNFIQKEFAYGIRTQKIADGVYILNFVSYKKMKFRLERDKGNVWRVYSNLQNGGRMILRRIYIHVNGGSFWKPHIEYVELKGADPATHKEIRERITLKNIDT